MTSPSFMEAMSHRTMDRKILIPKVSSHVSYVNEAFCTEAEGSKIHELLGAIPNKRDPRDSKPKPTLTRKSKPGSFSFYSQVHKVPQSVRQLIEKPSSRSKTSRQRFGRTDIVRQVARINESSEIRECLSFLCVLLLGAAGVGVFLVLLQFTTDSTVTGALTVIGLSVILVFIFICITTFLKDGTSLHRS